MVKQTRRFQLVLFVLVSYSILWVLFGIGKLFEFPFTYDPGELVGILWAVWHLPLFFMPGSSQYGQSLIPYIYLLTCWTIIMALFVGKARGSVLPGILIHESANFAIRNRPIFSFYGFSVSRIKIH